MSEILDPRTLFEELSFLKNSSPEIYLNFSTLLDATFKMQRGNDAEEEFSFEEAIDYDCYDFSPENEILFREDFHIFANAKTYVYIAKKLDFLAVYCVDSRGIIRFRITIFGFDEVFALKEKYSKIFRQCMPKYHVQKGG